MLTKLPALEERRPASSSERSSAIARAIVPLVDVSFDGYDVHGSDSFDPSQASPWYLENTKPVPLAPS